MKNSKTNIKKVLIPLIILPLVSCGPKYEIQNVIYVSGDQTLYSTERHIYEDGHIEYGDYVGNTPVKESVEDGIYLITYTFSGWSSKEYEDKVVYTAEFESEKGYNPKYEDVSNKSGLVEFMKSQRKSEVYLNINGSYDYYDQYRYTLEGSYYLGYVPSIDLFSITFGGTAVVSVSFKYQRFNSTLTSCMASVGYGYEEISASVSNHELSSFSGSNPAKTYLKRGITLANEFGIKNGFGFITD